MRVSKFLFATLKETPAEAEAPSHRLMLRTGMISQVAAGIYNYLPLAVRTIAKVEAIIRKAMNDADAVEVFMPSVQPAELWEESGRYAKYGRELLRFVDRKDRPFVYGPTHEEVVTDIARRTIRSYKQLPVNLYQIQTKFRDEFRPRFGVMRGREFLMKDAYSFDADEEGAAESYRKMYDAYTEIFNKCGLRYRAVEADSGAIGGSFSHEFMVLADTGEDAIASCNKCEYAANTEKATSRKPAETEKPELLSSEKVETPEKKSIDELSDFLGVNKSDCLKALLFESSAGPLVIFIRGDLEANEIKISNELDLEWLKPAEENIEATFGAPAGYFGPIGLKVPYYADRSVINMSNFVIGAGEVGYHIKNANFPRDFKIEDFRDFAMVSGGEGCPKCESGTLVIERGIEVGHVFKLGTKYSEAMKAEFLDINGKHKPLVMGCYGIGVTRTVAAAIEQNHDDRGINWPVQIAPFELYLMMINSGVEEQTSISDELYQKLSDLGIEVLYDDRPERAGVKFKDADLIGIPLRATVGKKAIEEGLLECKWRDQSEPFFIKLDNAAEELAAMIEKKRRGE